MELNNFWEDLPEKNTLHCSNWVGGPLAQILILTLLSEKLVQIVCRGGGGPHAQIDLTLFFLLKANVKKLPKLRAGVGVIWAMPKRKNIFFLGGFPLQDQEDLYGWAMLKTRTDAFRTNFKL